MFQELFLSELLSIMTVEWAETCGGNSLDPDPKGQVLARAPTIAVTLGASNCLSLSLDFSSKELMKLWIGKHFIK